MKNSNSSCLNFTREILLNFETLELFEDKENVPGEMTILYVSQTFVFPPLCALFFLGTMIFDEVQAFHLNFI